MNKDTAKGTFNDAAGRAKRQIGEWTNDPEKEVEGAAQQIKGKAQKVVGQVKDAVHDSNTDKPQHPDGTYRRPNDDDPKENRPSH